MTLKEAKKLIELIEPKLGDTPFVVLHVFERDGRKLVLAITDRFRRSCMKGHIWKSKPMLTALKNAEYGFDPYHANSSGGSDGIFILTRDYKPKNEMMRKLFNRFIDKPRSSANIIAEKLGSSLNDLIPARLVSHHMRLLGLLQSSNEEDTLVLVDYDNTK